MGTSKGSRKIGMRKRRLILLLTNTRVLAGTARDLYLIASCCFSSAAHLGRSDDVPRVRLRNTLRPNSPDQFSALLRSTCIFLDVSTSHK